MEWFPWYTAEWKKQSTYKRISIVRNSQCNKGDIRNTHESTCVHEKYLKHKSETKEIGYLQGAQRRGEGRRGNWNRLGGMRREGHFPKHTFEDSFDVKHHSDVLHTPPKISNWINQDVKRNHKWNINSNKWT